MATRATPAASRSLLTGAALLATARYAVAAMGWIGSIIVVRELTPPQFGAFTTVFGLLGMIGLLSELRMSRRVLEEIVDADDETSGRIAGAYVALRLLVGFAGYAVALLVVAVADYPRSVVGATVLGGSILVVESTWYGTTLLFQARMWQRSVALSQMAGQMTQLALICTIAVAGLGSVVWFTVPAVVNALVALAWLVLAARGVAHIRLGFDPERWKAWAKEAAPLSLGYALESIYYRIDVLMLSVMATFSAVGAYGVAYKFADLVGALPVALLAPVLPVLVVEAGDRARFHHTFRTMLVILCAGAVGVAVGFTAFAGELITLLYGPRYRVADDAARFLVAAQAVHFLSALAVTTLIARGRNVLYPLAALAGVALNVGMNVWLIPRHSFDGSAWATLATEIAVLGVLGVGVSRVCGVRPFPWAAMARAVLCGGALAILLALAWSHVPWWILAASSPAVYLALLHLVRVDGPGGLRALVAAARLDAAPLEGTTEADRRRCHPWWVAVRASRPRDHDSSPGILVPNRAAPKWCSCASSTVPGAPSTCRWRAPRARSRLGRGTRASPTSR